MELLGLPLGTLLQAGGILSAVLVVFYILKLKRRPIPVPFASLWQKILRDKEATTLFSQLKRLLSLLLQLVLVALLLLALGDPQPTTSKETGRNVVILVDASASMKATDVPQDAKSKAAKRTRLDVGIEQVREAIRGVGGGDRMLIAQMDASVTPLTTMTNDVSELEGALAKIEATDVRAQFATALRYAVDSLRDLEDAEIVIVSDGALDEATDAFGTVELGDIKLSFVPVGSASNNVAITEFAVRRYKLDKSRYEVLLEVTNTGNTDAEFDLELYGDDDLTDIVTLTVAAGESMSRFYPNLSGADKTLEARLKPRGATTDLLPADNHAYALLPERRRASIQLVSAGNMYLDAALLLDEYLDVTPVEPSEYPAKGKFDITIFDNVAPPRHDDSGDVLYLNPPAAPHLPFKVGDEIKGDAKYALGFDELDDTSPIVSHLSLGDVNVVRGHELKGNADLGDKEVGKSFKGTLLLAGERDGYKFVALGLDIRESDLPLRIAWPLFVINTIDSFTGESDEYISSFRTGTVWKIPASRNTKTATIRRLPAGEPRVVPVKDSAAVFLGQQAGFYELRYRDDNGESVTKVAGSLSDRQESSIAPEKQLAIGEKEAGTLEGFKVHLRREFWLYLLLAAVGLTAIEWFTFHRRVTV